VWVDRPPGSIDRSIDLMVVVVAPSDRPTVNNGSRLSIHPTPKSIHPRHHFILQPIPTTHANKATGMGKLNKKPMVSGGGGGGGGGAKDKALKALGIKPKLKAVSHPSD
jgi:hypothetical protein